MVLSWSEQGSQGSGSPWARIEALQREAHLPVLLIPQPAHAVLAGELAAALLPAGFGDLPEEIVRAIQMHDTGWASSDAQQIQRLRAEGGGKGSPVSFVTAPPGEAMEAWTASIDSVETLSKAGAVVVSRHFCLLAQNDAARHKAFLQAETSRQRRFGVNTPQREEEFDRWTAALGFCDLVSLYLACGLSGEVEFPLAHPASPRAQAAPRVKMQIAGRSLRVPSMILRPGSKLSVQGLKHPLPAQGPRAETLAWQVE
jgi:hypothetical protein